MFVNISQPLLDQTGQLRWALSNVADLSAPPCQPLQALMQK